MRLRNDRNKKIIFVHETVKPFAITWAKLWDSLAGDYTVADLDLVNIPDL